MKFLPLCLLLPSLILGTTTCFKQVTAKEITLAKASPKKNKRHKKKKKSKTQSPRKKVQKSTFRESMYSPHRDSAAQNYQYQSMTIEGGVESTLGTMKGDVTGDNIQYASKSDNKINSFGVGVAAVVNAVRFGILTAGLDSNTSSKNIYNSDSDTETKEDFNSTVHILNPFVTYTVNDIFTVALESSYTMIRRDASRTTNVPVFEFLLHPSAMEVGVNYQKGIKNKDIAQEVKLYTRFAMGPVQFGLKYEKIFNSELYTIEKHGYEEKDKDVLGLQFRFLAGNSMTFGLLYDKSSATYKEIADISSNNIELSTYCLTAQFFLSDKMILEPYFTMTQGSDDKAFESEGAQYNVKISNNSQALGIILSLNL